MENFDQPLDMGLDSSASEEGLVITPQVRNTWRELSGWMLFLAILSFIFTAILLLALLSIIFVGSQSASKSADIVPAVVVLLLMLAGVFFPGWCFFKFSSLTRQSMRFESAASLEAAFVHLKRYYRLAGILTIVIASIYLFSMVR